MGRNIKILGAPMDYGANRRGVGIGPSAIRCAGLAGELESVGVSPTDAGDLVVPHHTTRDTDTGAANARHVKEVEEVTRSLADAVSTALAEGMTSLTLGGDRSIAIGSLVGSARDADIGVIWFDAHDGFNTPSTLPSGNVHGIPLAAALGIDDFMGVKWANTAGLKEENVAIVDLRSVDGAEAEAIRGSDMTVYTISDIDERGITDVMNGTLDVVTNGTDGVHISLNLDQLGPREVPGVGTPVRGGVICYGAHTAMGLVARLETMHSFELVEVSPILDEHNKVATLATELATNAFGKRIL